MKIVKAHARTGRYFNYDNNSDKFYRVIQAGPFTVFQNGRVGSAIGQLQIKQHSSEGAARVAADRKWDEKTGPRARDRYGDHEYVDFDVDLDRITEDKGSASQVIHVFLAANRTGEGTPSTQPGGPLEPSQPVTSMDRLTRLTQRALDVIELSVSQPREAMTAFVDVNEEWAALQEEIEKVKGYVTTAEQLATTL